MSENILSKSVKWVQISELLTDIKIWIDSSVQIKNPNRMCQHYQIERFEIWTESLVWKDCFSENLKVDSKGQINLS